MAFMEYSWLVAQQKKVGLSWQSIFQTVQQDSTSEDTSETQSETEQRNTTEKSSEYPIERASDFAKNIQAVITNQEESRSRSASEASSVTIEDGVDCNSGNNHDNEKAKLLEEKHGVPEDLSTNHLQRLTHKSERRSSGSDFTSREENTLLDDRLCLKPCSQNSAADTSKLDLNHVENGKRSLPKSSSAYSLPVSANRRHFSSNSDSFRSLKSSSTTIWSAANTDNSPTSSKQELNRNSSTLSDSMKNIDKRNLQKYSKKKRSPSWYSVFLSSSYKQKNDAFHKCFKQLPESERLLVDCTCALMKDILIQGRMYISQNYICFHSNILRWQTAITIKFKNIEQITKERTVKVFPNAIQFQIKGKDKAPTFTSFTQRDRTYQQIHKLWQNALADKPMTAQEMWSNVRNHYGADLGCSSEEDYVKPDSSLNDAINTSSSKVKRKKKQKVEHVSKSGSGEDIAKRDDSLSAKPSLSSDEGKYSNQASENDLSGIFFMEGSKTESAPTDNSVIDEGPCKHPIKHCSREYYVKQFDVSAECLYRILYDEEFDFFQTYLEKKSCKSIVIKKWKMGSGEHEGNRVRELSFNLPLSAPILPKFSQVEELQVFRKESVPGCCYVVDCIAQSFGIPYSDYISTIARHSITKLSPTSCELRVTVDIVYHKTPWGLVKNFIVKNVHSGMEENFPLLERHLLSYLTRTPRPQSLPVPFKSSTTVKSKKSNSPSTTTTFESLDLAENSVSPPDQLGSQSNTTSKITHSSLDQRSNLDENANYKKSYQHKVEITNGKWFFRLLCMLFVLLLWSNYTMYRRITTLEQLHPDISKKDADFQTYNHISDYDVNSGYYEKPSSNFLQSLERRLSSLEDLLRNLTRSSELKWSTINHEWKELHKSVTKLIEVTSEDSTRIKKPT